MNKKGGAREGAGRPTADGVKGPFVSATISILETQREKLATLGGSAFIRKMIEKEYAKCQLKK